MLVENGSFMAFACHSFSINQMLKVKKGACSATLSFVKTLSSTGEDEKKTAYYHGEKKFFDCGVLPRMKDFFCVQDSYELTSITKKQLAIQIQFPKIGRALNQPPPS